MKQPRTHLPFTGKRTTGSAMITSIIFATIIMFGLAGLLPLALTNWKMTSRTSGQEAAFSLAECGIEEAIWAIIEFGDEDGEWKSGGWSESNNGAYWYREILLSDYSKQLGDIYELDEGRAGKYRIVVQKATSSTIHIISQGIVEGGENVVSDYKATRYIETQFKRPNPFELGLVAKESLTFNGQPSFSSFHSGQDAWQGAINWKAVASSPFRENATVGSLSTDASKVSAGNAKIFGDMATGASDDGTNIQGGASLTGEIIYDFEMDLPEVTTPSTSGVGWNTTL